MRGNAVLAALALAVVAALCGAGIAPAAARPAFKPFGTSLSEPVLSRHHMILKQRAGILEVIDTRRGGGRREVAVSPECGVTHAHGAHALVNCPRAAGDMRPEVLDLRTGALAPVPGWRDGDGFAAIGLYWLIGCNFTQQPVHCGSVALNWRTGERVAGRLNPNEPGVDRHLPAPRRSVVFDNGPRRPGELSGNDLYLRHRGERRIHLSRCPGQCASPVYWKRMALWIERGRLYAYDDFGRRRKRVVARSPAMPAHSVAANRDVLVASLRSSEGLAVRVARR